MNESATVIELVSEKYENFKQRFADEIAEITRNDQFVFPAVTDLIAGIATSAPLHGLWRSRDVDTIAGIALLDEKHAVTVDRALRVYKALPADRQELFWRYVDFFLEAINELSHV